MPMTMDIKKIVEDAGGEETIEVTLRRFNEDVHYLQSIRLDLLRQYMNQWVAIYERNLVAHGKSTSELRRQLTKKGVPSNEAVVDFMSSERKALLL